jgi:hypothetical protein
LEEIGHFHALFTLYWGITDYRASLGTVVPLPDPREFLELGWGNKLQLYFFF